MVKHLSVVAPRCSYDSDWLITLPFKEMLVFSAFASFWCAPYITNSVFAFLMFKTELLLVNQFVMLRNLVLRVF